VGLVCYGAHAGIHDTYFKPATGDDGVFSGIVGRMKGWFANFF
jgi:hypothetical protein